jgi:hypothetical protein
MAQQLEKGIAGKVLLAMNYGMSVNAQNWYKESTSTITSLVGEEDKDLMTACIALTSPMRTVKANCDLAVRTFFQIKEGGEKVLIGIPSHHNPALISYLKTGVWGTGYSKTYNFYQNLSGNHDIVTVDSQMFTLFNLPRKTSSIQLITEKIEGLGRLLNMKPANVQSCLWEGHKKILRENNQGNGNARQSGSYKDYLPYKYKLLKNENRRE